MRVLLVSKALVVGQYQTKLEWLAQAPGVELGAVVPLCWRDERGSVPLEKAHLEGYRLWVSPLRLNGSFHLYTYPGIGRILRAFRPDVVHIDEEPYNLATAHILHATRAAAPGAQTLFFTWQNLARTYPLPFRRLERYVYRSADYALAGTEAAATVLREKGFCKPLAVIPQFGVEAETFRPASRARSGPFTIGYAGRLVPEKGVDLLLRALGRLDGEWQARVVGSGPERAALVELSRALGLTRVRFEPPRLSLNMPALYNELDALVLPSVSRPNWIEQFGRVLIEAMACEVPVIGSTCGEIPQVIGDGGLVFAEGDVDALRRHLQTLKDNPELRAELGRRGRARVLAHYTQQQIAASTVSVYEAMLACAGAPAAAAPGSSFVL